MVNTRIPIKSEGTRMVRIFMDFDRNTDTDNLSSISRVVFTREKFLHFVCSLPHGNHSDSNNPLTKMHTLTHIGHRNYNVQVSMKSSIKFNLIFLVNLFVLNHLKLAQIMVFFCCLCHKIDQKCKISAKFG